MTEHMPTEGLLELTMEQVQCIKKVSLWDRHLKEKIGCNENPSKRDIMTYVKLTVKTHDIPPKAMDSTIVGFLSWVDIVIVLFGFAKNKLRGERDPMNGRRS